MTKLFWHALVRPPALLVVAVLLYFLGIGWIALFPVATVTMGRSSCRETFVSENALPRHFVPAAVTRSDSWNRVRRDAFSLNISSRISVEDVSRRISRQLRALGASEVVELSPVPCGSAEAVDAVQNIVGIVKGAGRMANQEAVVVAAPVRVSEWDETSLDVESHPVVALFHLVATVETAPWLSKDVLFIISVSRSGCGCLNHVGVPCDDVGLRSWASVYLDGKGKQVGPQFGLLRGAVVLDWNPRDVTKNSNIALHIPSDWGRLPDMDIVTLVARSCQFPVSTSSWAPCPLSDSYASRIRGLAAFMTSVAVGPYAPHHVFLSRNIDSFTLSVRMCANKNTVSENRRRHFMASLAGSAEVFVNAISTMEEKLHASYYFYFLLSYRYFVSFGEYIYAGGLVLLFPGLAVVLALSPGRALLLDGFLDLLKLYGPITLLWGAVSRFVTVATPVWSIGLGVAALTTQLSVVAFLSRIRKSLSDASLTVLLFAATLPLLPFGMKNFPLMLLSGTILGPLFVFAAAMPRLNFALRTFTRVVSLVVHPGVWLIALGTVWRAEVEFSIRTVPVAVVCTYLFGFHTLLLFRMWTGKQKID